jgi:hypothetical protein
MSSSGERERRLPKKDKKVKSGIISKILERSCEGSGPCIGDV